MQLRVYRMTLPKVNYHHSAEHLFGKYRGLTRQQWLRTSPSSYYEWFGWFIVPCVSLLLQMGLGMQGLQCGLFDHLPRRWFLLKIDNVMTKEEEEWQSNFSQFYLPLFLGVVSSRLCWSAVYHGTHAWLCISSAFSLSSAPTGKDELTAFRTTLEADGCKGIMLCVGNLLNSGCQHTWNIDVFCPTDAVSLHSSSWAAGGWVKALQFVYKIASHIRFEVY